MTSLFVSCFLFVVPTRRNLELRASISYSSVLIGMASRFPSSDSVLERSPGAFRETVAFVESCDKQP